MDLNSWMQRWNLPVQAYQELRAILGVIPAPEVAAGNGRREADVQSRVRLAAAQMGYGLWRNNVGATKDERGNFFRFGLANESAKMNTHIKSGDLIGLRPIRISQADVGSLIGQFVSYEVKPEGWRYTGTPREAAQRKWAEIVTMAGGHAKFITGADQL